MVSEKPTALHELHTRLYSHHSFSFGNLITANDEISRGNHKIISTRIIQWKLSLSINIGLIRTTLKSIVNM